MSTIGRSDIDTKLQRSAIDIAMYTPFLMRACLSLPMIARDDVQTMATDGVAIYYSPTWVETITLAEFTAVRVHELMHVMLGHHLRMRGRDARRWNHATDYALNPFVLDANYVLPSGALVSSDYIGLSAEEIYPLLPFDGDIAPRAGEVFPSPDNEAKAEAAWRVLAQSTRWGQLPKTLDRAISTSLCPQPLLVDLLIPLLSQHFPDDYSFARPSRRATSDVILPGLTGRRGRVVIAIDTSGSINASTLTTMWDAAQAIPAVAEVDVVCADAEVQLTALDIQSAGELVAMAKRAKGGGGTDFRPALVWADQRDPDAVVYFTDGAGIYPPMPTRAPVIWVLTDEATTPPWGATIQIKNRR